MGLHGWASIVLRASFARGQPLRLEIGRHVSWALANPEVAAPLELRQIDAEGGTVWFRATHHPGRAFNLFLEVDRGELREELGLVVVCEE